MTDRVVERDTVAPNKPDTLASLSGDILDQRMNINVIGEGESKLDIEVSISGTNNTAKKFSRYLNKDGKISISDILGKLVCQSEYTIKTKLIDRAQNESEIVETKIETMECPVCPTYDIGYVNGTSMTFPNADGKFQTPFKRQIREHESGQRFGAMRQGFSHEGLDFGAYLNEPIYPIMEGEVIYAGSAWSGYRGGYATIVKITHPNGTISEYAHVESMYVKAGERVDKNTKIAGAGQRGYSDGVHLHLNLKVNKKNVDPWPYLYQNAKPDSYPTLDASNTQYYRNKTNAGNLNVEQQARHGCTSPDLPTETISNSNGSTFDLNSASSRERLKTGTILGQLERLKKTKECIDYSFTKLSSKEKISEMLANGYIRLDTKAEMFGAIIKSECYATNFGQLYNFAIEIREREILALIEKRTNDFQLILNEIGLFSRLVGTANKFILEFTNYVVNFVKENWKEIVGFIVTVIADLVCNAFAIPSTTAATVATGGVAAPAIVLSVGQCLVAGAAFGAAVKQVINISDGKPFNFGEMAIDTVINYLGALVFKYIADKVILPVISNSKNYLARNFGDKTLKELESKADDIAFKTGIAKYGDAVCNCFVAGTLISTIVYTGTNKVVNNSLVNEAQLQVLKDNNQITETKLPIESLIEGDYLITKNVLDKSSEVERRNDSNYLKDEYKAIKYAITQIKEEMAKVEVYNPITNTTETLTTTKDHEWIVFNSNTGNNHNNLKNENQTNLFDHKEKRTYNLVQGDKIINQNNQELEIQSVQLFNQPTTTYNFTINDNHNYLVGEEGVLVHNTCRLPLTNFNNTTNLKSNFVDHMEGEVSGTIAKGFHSTLSTIGRKVGNNYDELLLPNGDKVYKAIVEVQNSSGNWIRKARADGTAIPSSFFPDNWSYQKIIDKVNQAYIHGKLAPNNSPQSNLFTYLDPETGLIIGFYKEQIGASWGKVISAFPII
jgi:murein DD-endopeptidase MepM/ murein hydrolase activator NlpD